MFRRLTSLALAAALCAAASPQTVRAQDGLSGQYLAGIHALQRNDPVAAAEYLAEVARRDPGNGFVLEQALLNQVLAGDMVEAARSAERLVYLAAEHRLANLVLVVRDFRRGGYAAALKRLQERRDSFHPLIGRLLEVWAAQGEGQPEAADAALAALGENGLDAVMRGYHGALLSLLRGEPERAAEALARVRTDLGARSTGMTVAEGIALEQAGRVEEASALYAEFAGDRQVDQAAARLAAGGAAPLPVAGPDEGAADVLFTMAGLIGREGDGRSAIAHARLAVHLQPDLEPAILMIAGRFSADDNHELAAETLAAIPPDSPNAVRAEIGRAEALEALERRDEAIALMQRLRQAHPDDPDVAVTLGDILRRGEDWIPCADAYDAAIAMLEDRNRATWWHYYQRGICHERADLWARAEVDFLKALEMEPEQPFVLNYLGYSWVEMGRNLDEAKGMIERAVEQEPENGYITDSLGWVLYRLGDYDGAVEWLEKAVELAPVDPVINDHLGDALWMVGRRLEARFQWKRARSFDPEPDELARINHKLDVGLDAVLEQERAEAATINPEAAQASKPADGG
jgi:tetratricopeptide (TPR) repeat protein